MQDGFVGTLRDRNPRVAALLDIPATRKLPRLPAPALEQLARNVTARVTMLYGVIHKLERENKPYAIVSYSEFCASAADKKGLIGSVETGEFVHMSVEEARTAEPLKTLFLAYEVEGRRCKFMICTAGNEHLDKQAKKAVARKLAEITGRTADYSATRVIAAFGMHASDEVLAGELGLISGVSGPIISVDKLADVDAIIFTKAALEQELSEVALTRLHGLIIEARTLFDSLSELNPRKYFELERIT